MARNVSENKTNISAIFVCKKGRLECLHRLKCVIWNAIIEHNYKHYENRKAGSI